jgi:hypothetical protein
MFSNLKTGTILESTEHTSPGNYLCQNQLFENFENWQVSEYGDKLITSSIRPSFEEQFNEHWFGPILVHPYMSGEPQTQFQNLYVYI